MTVRVGESASQGDATATHIREANYIPGPSRETYYRFDFTEVTAWHAPAYEDAIGVLRAAQEQAVNFVLEVNWCCAPPVEERPRPNIPDSGVIDLTKLAIIIILVIVVLGAFQTCFTAFL